MDGRILTLFAVAGGDLGCASPTIRPSKWYFAAGLPAFIILHIALFLLVHGAGLV